MLDKKILIIESKLSHWTTVEPLIVCFLERGWKVDVLSDNFFSNIFGEYSDIHKLDKYKKNININSIKLSSLLALFFKSKYNITIVSDRFFYEKNIDSSLLSKIKTFIFSIVKTLLIKNSFRHSYFIITTHFVDNFKLPDKSYSKHTVINLLLKKVWNLSRKYNKGINVYSSLVKKNFEEKNKKIYVAPNAVFRYHLNDFQPNDARKCTIVSPGRIDLRRRSYKWISRLDKSLSGTLNISLIGKAHNNKDLDVLKQLENKGFKQYVTKINQFIDFQDFDFQIEKADFLFAPLINLDDSKRKIDRNLGAYFDAIRYGKPLLLPSYVPIPDELIDSCLSYGNDEELIKTINLLINDIPFRNKVKLKAWNNSKNWSPSQISYIKTIIRDSGNE